MSRNGKCSNEILPGINLQILFLVEWVVWYFVAEFLSVNFVGLPVRSSDYLLSKIITSRESRAEAVCSKTTKLYEILRWWLGT